MRSKLILVFVILLMIFISPVYSYAEVPKYQISQKIEYDGRNIFVNVSKNINDEIVFQVRATDTAFKAIQASAILEDERLHVKLSNLETFSKIFNQPYKESSKDQVKILLDGWLYELISHYADLLIVHSEFLNIDLSRELVARSIEESGIYPFSKIIKVLNIPEINLQDLKMEKRDERDDIISAFRLSNKNIKMYMNFVTSK